MFKLARNQKLVRAFQFVIKVLVKWIRLGEARSGKVEFLDILTLPIKFDLIDD